MTDELIQRIADVLNKHYPEAQECSDCGTHLECSCNYAHLDSWTSRHVAEQIVAALPEPNLEKVTYAVWKAIRAESRDLKRDTVKWDEFQRVARAAVEAMTDD